MDQTKPGKQRLFSVTAADCRWDFYVASGDGGQNRQKRNTAVRCTHIASGAVGKSSDGRSQHQNRKAAFEHMATTKEFQTWLKIETARVEGRARSIEEQVDREMQNVRTEIKDANGRWTPGEPKEDPAE